MEDSSRRLPIQQLRSVYRSVALALGADAAEADIYADCYARADLRHDTQGLSLWLEWGLPMAEAGGGRFGVTPVVTGDTAACVRVDGQRGFGQVIATRVMSELLVKSATAGVAFATVANITEIAMAANYAMQCLEHDCIGLAMSTAGPPNVAPWGSRDALFGPNPLACAVPTASGPPLVIDMSCATYSVGTLVNAARLGKVNASATVVDASGRYRVDPASIVSDLSRREPPLTGAILPEGPKGSALLLLVEILAGLLSGAGPSAAQTQWTAASPPNVGAFLGVIRIAPFADVTRFKQQVAAYLANIMACTPAEGFAKVVFPGLRAAELERARLLDGIPVCDRHYRGLLEVCRKYSLV